jgi:hypothetical protein
MIIGLLSLLGSAKRGVEGAILPTSGAANVSTGVGDSQEDSSCCNVIFSHGISRSRDVKF